MVFKGFSFSYSSSIAGNGILVNSRLCIFLMAFVINGDLWCNLLACGISMDMAIRLAYYGENVDVMVVIA